MTESELRQKVVDVAKLYLGTEEGSDGHHHIIDTYNGHSPLARNYKVKYADSWCAAFASFCLIEAGLAGLLTTECGCGEMVSKNPGIWVENDDYVPKPGDLVFYDWQDSGTGDSAGWPDHVGIVEKVTGQSVSVIEGNSEDKVRRLTRTVGQQYIRGYLCPDYASLAEEEPYQQWVGTVTTFLNVRTAPNKDAEKYRAWPLLGPGNKVRVVGERDGWYDVVIADKHLAWVSAKYVKRA